MHLAPATLLLDDISAWKRALSPLAPRPAGLLFDRASQPKRGIEESEEFLPGEDDAVWIERVQDGDEEAARAMAIRKIAPEKLNTYFLERGKRRGSSYWDASLQASGIDVTLHPVEANPSPAIRPAICVPWPYWSLVFDVPETKDWLYTTREIGRTPV